MTLRHDGDIAILTGRGGICYRAWWPHRRLSWRGRRAPPVVKTVGWRKSVVIWLTGGEIFGRQSSVVALKSQRRDGEARHEAGTILLAYVYANNRDMQANYGGMQKLMRHFLRRNASYAQYLPRFAVFMRQ